MGVRREKFISIHLPLLWKSRDDDNTHKSPNEYLQFRDVKSGKQIWNIDEMETFSQHTNGSHCHSFYCDMTHARKLLFIWKRKETEEDHITSECLICQSRGGGSNDFKALVNEQSWLETQGTQFFPFRTHGSEPGEKLYYHSGKRKPGLVPVFSQIKGIKYTWLSCS